MNDTMKHVGGTVTSYLGFFGAITLSDVNAIVSIVCGTAGTIAAVYTIYSIWAKGRKEK